MWAPGIRQADFGHAGQLLENLLSQPRDVASDGVAISIERPAKNVRTITGSCVVDSSMEDVWAVLTDYDRLAERVPNLVQSHRVPHPDPEGIRLYQEGAKRVIGFDFHASLIMDMTEWRQPGPESYMVVGFNLVESQMFRDFHGHWRLRDCERQPQEGDTEAAELLSAGLYCTEMQYRATVQPRGMVPVSALEWHIRQEVPANMLALKAAAEQRRAEMHAAHEAAPKLAAPAVASSATRPSTGVSWTAK